MKKILSLESISIGLAMFSMFFGAGNVIFPLALGQFAADQSFYAILGLIVTAIIMPFLGVLSMILFNGSHREFFGRLGKIPGLVLALIIITLLGPIGSTPRCIALTYSTMKSVFPGIQPVLFCGLSCFLVYLLSFKKNRILSLLGWVLTPLLLASLIAIVCIGLWKTPEIASLKQNGISVFWHGLKEGYNTMDLLAAFFFSSAILSLLKERQKSKSLHSPIKLSLQASFIGAFLLTLVYIGFCLLAAFHGDGLQGINKDELLSAIALKIAGPSAGILVCIAIALTCLTTAVALISVFSDFLQKEVFKEKVKYETILLVSILLTFAISTMQFTGIAAFLTPILIITYPGLILFTILNIWHKLTGFKPLKWPVFLTFGVSALLWILK